MKILGFTFLSKEERRKIMIGRGYAWASGVLLSGEMTPDIVLQHLWAIDDEDAFDKGAQQATDAFVKQRDYEEASNILLDALLNVIKCVRTGGNVDLAWKEHVSPLVEKHDKVKDA